MNRGDVVIADFPFQDAPGSKVPMNPLCKLALVCVLAFQSSAAWAVAPLRSAAPNDPLPPGALARLGHARMVCPYTQQLILSPDGKMIYASVGWRPRDGKSFRLTDGKEIPAPVRIPAGYSLHRIFSDGSYIVTGKKGLLLYPPGNSDKPRSKSAEYPPSLEVDADGRHGIYISPEELGGVLLLADLKQPGKIQWRPIVSPFRAEWAQLSDRGSHIVWGES